MARIANEHKWTKINTRQSRCNYCGILRTYSFVTKESSTIITYTDNNNISSTEYIVCTGKPDLSEFYK